MFNVSWHDVHMHRFDREVKTIRIKTSKAVSVNMKFSQTAFNQTVQSEGKKTTQKFPY